MRILTDQLIDSLSLEDVKSKLEDFVENITGINDHCEQLQRSRTLVLWHDHSTVAGSGYLLMTIHSLYDPAVYLSTAESERNTGRKCTWTVQEIVEEPELYNNSVVHVKFYFVRPTSLNFRSIELPSWLKRSHLFEQ